MYVHRYKHTYILTNMNKRRDKNKQAETKERQTNKQIYRETQTNKQKQRNDKQINKYTDKHKQTNKKYTHTEIHIYIKYYFIF